MEYTFEIVFKRQYAVNNIHMLRFTSKRHNVFDQLVECYGKADLVVFLKEFLSLFTEVPTTQEISNLGEEELKVEIQRLLSDNDHLKSVKQSLETQVSQLSESRSNIELRNLRDENQRLSRDLATERNRSSQQSKYYQDANDYQNLRTRWGQLFRQFRTLEELSDHINALKVDIDKLQKLKQNSDRRVQEMEKELQETQGKLYVAIERLRGVNTHSELGGGESRSDQLKNEFSHLKMGLFNDVSTEILNNWRDQDSTLTFRSEEFSRIKSILSQRVFGDGMAYFAKDKTEVDTELHLVMDTLESIKDFSPTAAVFREIQEKIQVGLLRSKGVDHSGEALVQYIEETTHGINQDLQKIADLKITDETLSEIRNFVERGLKLVRDIVNDSNSGELFIPENRTIFDDNAHETRDDHKGQIKMTLYAGYRIKGTVLVKADVITYEPEATPPANEPDLVNPPQPTDPPNSQPESRIKGTENTDDDATTTENTGSTADPSFKKGGLNPKKSRSSDLSQGDSEIILEDSASKESEKVSKTFKGEVKGKVTFKNKSKQLACRNYPKENSKTGVIVNFGEVLTFEGWIIGEPWKERTSRPQEQDNRWYKVAGQNWWLPAFHIEGEPPSDMPPMQLEGGGGEAQ